MTVEKVYLVMGPLPGHAYATIPYSVHKTLEDAQFFVDSDKIIFGTTIYIEEMRLGCTLKKEYMQKLIDAGKTIPEHLVEK